MLTKILNITTLLLLLAACQGPENNYLNLSAEDGMQFYKQKRLDVTEEFKDGDALIDLGLHLFHAPFGAGGTSCASCHNVAKGGQADIALANGGSKHREIKSELISKHILTDVVMPFDKPAIKSTPFVNHGWDTLTLWRGIPNQNLYELQGSLGLDGHDMDAVEIFAQNDFLSRSLFQKAYDHDTISTKFLICAIAAYEQQVTSDRSNVAMGFVTRKEGIDLYKKYECQTCHGDHRLATALAPDPIHEKVKAVDLAGWIFSSSHTHKQIVFPVGKNALWELVKMHRDSDAPEYDVLDSIRYNEAQKIESFIKYDLTDYEMDRYERPKN